MTILYAEDDSMTVMEVQEKLENNGYEVIVAYDGNEALEKFIACKPDLIVLDVDMPGKDGLEVLQFIRLQDSQDRTSPHPHTCCADALYPNLCNEGRFACRAIPDFPKGVSYP